MSLQGIGFAVVGVALLVANAITMRSLWLSPIFETSQKVLQTLLLWVVPGSFMIVRHLVRETTRPAQSADPTVQRESGYTDATAPNHGHGHGDGGHHF